MKALIGVMPEELIRKRILAIAKGEYQPQERGSQRVVHVDDCAGPGAQQREYRPAASDRHSPPRDHQSVGRTVGPPGQQPVNHAENAERARPGGAGKTGAFGETPRAVYRFRDYRGSEVKRPL